MFALSEHVDSDDSGARTAIGHAACHGRTSRRNVWGRMLLQCSPWLTRCRCSEGGDRGRMHRTNGSSKAASWRKWTLRLHCPPSPQPASLEVLKRGFFVERCASFFRGRSKLFGPSWAGKWQAGCLHQRLSEGRPHPPTHKLPQWK